MTDALGPVAGVAVIQQGTTNGTATDIDGKYSITVPQGATLEISSIGYAGQSVTADRAVIDIFLEEDTEMIEETVVVGYGVQRKSDLTGAISSVKEEDMANRTLTDAAQALQGKTAGVYISMSSGTPGSEGTVRIRGVGSNGTSNPLYVVDGRISTSGISDINPEDIESIEVLKDGASTAIYGARAGNGVILVTTKKGEGEGRISYQFQESIQTFGKLPETMNAQEFYEYYTEAGTIGQSTFDTYWDGVTDTNWADEILETSVMTRHNLTFQKGDRDNSVYISAQYMDNNGAVKGDKDEFKRISFSLNGSWQFKKWLQLTTNNQFSMGWMKSIANDAMQAVVRMDPLTPAYYTYDELPADLKNVADNPDIYGELLSNSDGLYYGISHFTGGGVTNPFIQLYSSDTQNRFYGLHGSTALNFTPGFIPGLVFTSRVSYRVHVLESDTKDYDYYASGNSFANYASVSAELETPLYYQWENFANYSRSFGRHDFTLMAGMSFSESRSYYIEGEVTGAQDVDFGYLKDDPNYLYWAYRSGSAIPTVDGAEPIYNRNLSYYGRLNWNFANRYVAQVSLRADAADTSVLPVAQRWGYFPAASVGWTLTNEKFLSGLKRYVPYMKLRASWGANGSTASLSDYSWASSMVSSGFYPAKTGSENSDYQYITTYIPAYTGNDELKWESSQQLDLGVDLRFLSDRLAVTFDYFSKYTKDLIIAGARPSMSIGNVLSPINAGEISNKGVELEVNWQDAIGDLNYGIRANMATLKNMVEYVDPSVNTIDGLYIHPYGSVTRFQAGHPAWYFYGYKFAGIDHDTGYATFYDADGSITNNPTDAALTDIGSGLPKVTAGLTLNVGWKNFDLIAFFSGAFGQKTFMFYDHSDYTYNKMTMFTRDRWTETNKDGKYPAAFVNTMNYRNYLISDANVVRSDYVKLKQLQLGYSLPRQVLEKIHFQRVRLYVSLDDFFCWTPYKGYDPEVVGTGSSQGVDQGTYPMMRKCTFGVNLTF